jgi:multicomponent Na+:H+ antiporter subunit C
LPQALILTAIVIGFGTTALLLVLSLRAYQVTGTDHVQDLIEKADPIEVLSNYADPEHPSISPEYGPEDQQIISKQAKLQQVQGKHNKDKQGKDKQAKRQQAKINRRGKP